MRSRKTQTVLTGGKLGCVPLCATPGSAQGPLLSASVLGTICSADGTAVSSRQVSFPFCTSRKAFNLHSAEVV